MAYFCFLKGFFGLKRKYALFDDCDFSLVATRQNMANRAQRSSNFSPQYVSVVMETVKDTSNFSLSVSIHSYIVGLSGTI